MESLKVCPPTMDLILFQKTVQGVPKFLQFKWDLHTPWRPQSSGKIERMNQTPKRQLSMLCQETQLKWIDVLPIALMRIGITP